MIVQTTFHKFIAFLKNESSLDAPQRVLWIPVGLGLGIILYLSLSCEPSFGISLSVFMTSSFFLFITRNSPVLQFLSRALCILSLGFLVIQCRVNYLSTEMLKDRLDSVQLEGVVQSVEEKEDRTRVVLKSVRDGQGKEVLSSSIRLTLPKKMDLSPHPGDIIKGKATLLPISPPLLPGGYDFRRVAFFQGIGATGWFDDVVSVEESDTEARKVWLERVRNQVTQAILQSVPGHSGAIAAALVTGDRGKISPEIRQAYTDAGIAHILAISGLHLSLIAGLIFMIIRRGLCLSHYLSETYHLKKVASLVTIPILFIYLLISGMGVPAIRAFIMVSIVMIAVVLDRRAISMRLLAFAATIILCLQPEAVLSASFALSFAAVMGLVSVYQGGWMPFQDWMIKGGIGRRILAYLLGIVLTTLIASAVTLPLSMAIFNRLSVQAILGNLIGIPLTGFIIMPSLLLLVVCLPFGSIPLLGGVVSYSIQCLTNAALYIANLPGAAIPIPQPSSLFLWLFCLGGLWFLLWEYRWRYLGLIPVVCAFMYSFDVKDKMILIDSKGYLIWYDGEKLGNFADEENYFTEDMMKRYHGLTSIVDETKDSLSTTLGEHRILFLTRPFRGSKSEGIQLCKKYDFIVTKYALPVKCRTNESRVFVRNRRAKGIKPVVLSFSEKTGNVLELSSVTSNRPW